jgi:hypothetical protein
MVVNVVEGIVHSYIMSVPTNEIAHWPCYDNLVWMIAHMARPSVPPAATAAPLDLQLLVLLLVEATG